ncbi:MAG: hypothetical protein GY746_08935 [Gammaproteobacteria bacterium]|nr:hypothetical protein [Gammaproteobacteria bacterium]
MQDVKFGVCGHTLDAYGTTVNDLVGKFRRLNQGGVVRMVELQMQGFAYPSFAYSSKWLLVIHKE